MPMRITTGTADAFLTSLASSLNNGYIRIYSGTEPTTANTALDIPTTHKLLAELRFPATAFGAAGASGGNRMISAGTIVNEDAALADGTASFFRAIGSDGNTVAYQGTVGGQGSGQQLELSATNIVTGGVVSISALTVTMPVA